MSQHNPQEALKVYCTRCGGAMTVAPEHVQRRVGCPHCSQHIEPWRVHEQAEMETIAVAPPSGSSPQGNAGHRQPPSPPPPAPYYRGHYPMVSHRSKKAAGWLGLLGVLGIHRFYLGFTGYGVAQLMLTIFTGIGCLWGLIDGLMCLAGSIDEDAEGMKLRN